MADHEPSHTGRHRRRSRLTPHAVSTFAVAAVAVAVAVPTTIALTPGSTPAPAMIPVSATPMPTAKAPMTPLPVLDDQVTAVADIGFPKGVEMQVGIPDGLRPGLWQSMGGTQCAWSRSRGAGWQTDTGGHPGRPITIALRGTTSWFTTKNCALWTWSQTD